MNKKTKMLLGVGVVAVAAYYFWNKSKTKAAFANAAGVTVVAHCNGGGTCSSKGYNDPNICNSDRSCKKGIA